MSGFLKKLTEQSGAVAAGAVEITPVAESVVNEFENWLKSGAHGEMKYLQNYPELRRNPALLTDPPSRTLISLAFNHHSGIKRNPSLPYFASYALGEDYHVALRRRIENATEELKTTFGGVWRICIDSAPVMERYWAVRSGIATRCRNSMVAVKGYGQEVFIAEILTDIPIEKLLTEDSERVYLRPVTPDDAEPKISECTDCRVCVNACPAKALREHEDLRGNRCVNYLTIECRGEWNEEGREIMNNYPKPGTIYGCEICQTVCPMNKSLPLTEITEFQPDERLLNLTAEEVSAMGSAEFKRVFQKSAARRTGLATLKRNVSGTTLLLHEK